MAAMIIDVCKDKAGEWRWSMRMRRGGLIVGASTEGYKKRSAAVKNLTRVTGCPASILVKMDRTLWVAQVRR